MQPCNCKMSTTISNCGVDLCAPIAVCPPQVGHPGVTPPTITIEDLLKLIETKCDKETCKLLSYEIGLLYLLLELDRDDHSHPDHPLHPGNGGGTNPGNPGGGTPIPPVHHKKFQLIKNMVQDLKGGKLKDHYPSAQLLKDELLKLWQCLANKLQHHGEWKDNWSFRDIQQLPGGNCLFEHGKDPAPGKIKVVTPVDVGSTVFHEIEGKHCLFESLVDNNITEPSKLAVLEGKWMNYCDLKEVIDCVLPRKIITNCKDKCDDPNKDGVHEDLVLCKRVSNLEECVICTVIDTNTVDLTKTRLPDNGSTVKPSQVGNSIKADVIISKQPNNGIVAKPDGIWGDHVVNFAMVKNPTTHKNEYVITMGNGKKFTVPCCWETVAITSDAHTFKAETKPGGVDKSKFIRQGSVTIPAGTARALYQVNSSNAGYAHYGPTTGTAGSSGPHDSSSVYMGYRILVNGKVKGRQAWANDEDTIYKGDTSDVVAHMSEQMILTGGDVITMQVEYGDHTDQGMAPIGSIDFHADSAYIDILQIKNI